MNEFELDRFIAGREGVIAEEGLLGYIAHEGGVDEEAQFIHEAGTEKYAVQRAAAVRADGLHTVAGVQLFERRFVINPVVSGDDAVYISFAQVFEMFRRGGLGA